MSKFYASHGFSTNDVSGAFAVGLLRDLHVNGHAFRGFPAVMIDDTPDGFNVWLQLGNLKTEVLALSLEEGKKLAKDFQKKRDLAPAWMTKLQQRAAALEGEYDRKRDAR